MQSVEQQFAELMKRPDIDDAVARYSRLYTEIRQRLSTAFPQLHWEQIDVPGGAGCGFDFSEVNHGAEFDAVSRTVGSWAAKGSLPDPDWPRAVAIVDGVTRGYGFTSGPISPVDRPGEHQANFFDPYKAELVFGTAINTTLTFFTGCHLTAQAKQRGHLAPTTTP